LSVPAEHSQDSGTDEPRLHRDPLEPMCEDGAQAVELARPDAVILS
jgi:hypothetical protein